MCRTRVSVLLSLSRISTSRYLLFDLLSYFLIFLVYNFGSLKVDDGKRLGAGRGEEEAEGGKGS